VYGLVNLIQTIANATLAVLTGWTLKVLRDYAKDTKVLAENSSKQIENSQTPFVTLVMTPERVSDSEWAIKNQGFGVAVRISYTRHLGDGRSPTMQWTTSLGPGEQRRVMRGDGSLMNEPFGFKVEYQSLSGKKYRTTVRRTNDGSEEFREALN
jgi:hypothetical protein